MENQDEETVYIKKMKRKNLKNKIPDRDTNIDNDEDFE